MLREYSTWIPQSDAGCEVDGLSSLRFCWSTWPNVTVKRMEESLRIILARMDLKLLWHQQTVDVLGKM